MGVFPKILDQSIQRGCLPHARGGVSARTLVICEGEPSSPRTWGCFYATVSLVQPETVFPTHVGVFPDRAASESLNAGLPHARGGVSMPFASYWYEEKSSPRTWGCFCLSAFPLRHMPVFPTHVGVFLPCSFPVKSLKSLPHARGGVSGSSEGSESRPPSSPRTWGCFLMRRIQGLRRFSLPHARGGVSSVSNSSPPSRKSSPRTWGCFCLELVNPAQCGVFPTHVGVFPRSRYVRRGEGSLPHARGGVSTKQCNAKAFGMSSPRTWGCF